MPYKCSVKGCRSNYDSTNEKVSVFQFPTDENLRKKWLEMVQLNSEVLTNSSRVCCKHFDDQDIENSNNSRRNLLKSCAVPRIEIIDKSPRVHMMQDEFVESIIEIEYEKASLDDGGKINNFTYFCEALEQFHESIFEHWNIFTHEKGKLLHLSREIIPHY